MNDSTQMSNSSPLLGAHRYATQTVPLRTSLAPSPYTLSPPLPLPNGKSLVSPDVPIII